jgi:haloalkane dehalogenase
VTKPADLGDVFDRSHPLPVPGFGTVFVAEAGPVDGPPIVFLHGNPDSHHVWSGVVERLKATHRCIAPDMPGYGASDESARVTLEDQAAFVLALLDALALERPHLAIHDVGSTYGMAFTTLHAARVRTLTIFNGTFFPDYRWHFWGRVWRTPILGEITMLFGNEALFVSQVRKAAPKMPLDYARAAYAAYSPKTRRQVLRFYRWLDPERMRGWDTRLLEVLRSVKHQVIWGDLDPYIPKETADRLGVHGTVHHLSDTSHWAMAEEPARVATLIADLVR